MPPVHVLFAQGDGVAVTTVELDVMMGERRPEVGKAGNNGRVEATAGKHCQFDVPFSVQVGHGP